MSPDVKLVVTCAKCDATACPPLPLWPLVIQAAMRGERSYCTACMPEDHPAYRMAKMFKTARERAKKASEN